MTTKNSLLHQNAQKTIFQKQIVFFFRFSVTIFGLTSTQFSVIQLIWNNIVKNNSINIHTFLMNFTQSHAAFRIDDLFDFLDKVVGRLSNSFFVVHISPFFSKSSDTFCDVLTIHTVWSTRRHKCSINSTRPETLL